MTLGDSRRHNNSAKPSGRSRYRYHKRGSKHRNSNSVKYDTNTQENDENTNYNSNIKRIINTNKIDEHYKKKRYMRNTHRRNPDHYNSTNSQTQSNYSSNQKHHHISRRSNSRKNIYNNNNKLSIDKAEHLSHKATFNNKNAASPEIVTNLKIDDTIDLTKKNIVPATSSFENVDEERNNYFSYFSTIPETVIFGKKESIVSTPLKKVLAISRIAQMEGVFNISPASIIFKKKSRSEIFEQFRSS
jgi:hypothetical protein